MEPICDVIKSKSLYYLAATPKGQEQHTLHLKETHENARVIPSVLQMTPDPLFQHKQIQNNTNKPPKESRPTLPTQANPEQHQQAAKGIIRADHKFDTKTLRRPKHLPSNNLQILIQVRSQDLEPTHRTPQRRDPQKATYHWHPME
ncbi:uncharacterized protein BROUX77_007060 [Berkeleyomyces rouxiae]|uniref:uncharacterized protein n=1 Tax=Berkeleyomyces rouxiae TaxID=2035830 RepID=UPI003B763000